MAFRKGKRFGRRRPRARRGRKARSTVMVNRALQPIPQRYITKMKYAEVVFTDVDGQYTLNLNSLYDPNRTGGGHQPYGYDTFQTLYNRYRVISCGWRINHLLQPAVSTARIVAAIPSNDTAIIWGIDEMIENPRAKYITLQVGGPATVLRGKSYLPSLVGRSKAQYMADDNYQAVVTNSPTENALLYLKVTDQVGSPVGNTPVQVLLEFTAEFFDIKRQLQS